MEEKKQKEFLSVKKNVEESLRKFREIEREKEEEQVRKKKEIEKRIEARRKQAA